MANIPDAKQLDELSTNITELSQKICNSIIEIVPSTSNPEISEETRDTLVTLKFYMCNATLHEATRLRTNITHLIASFQNDSIDKTILNAFLEDLNLLIVFLEENHTANRKFQMDFIEELICANFASEPMYQTHIREKTSDPLKINSTNFQADEEIFHNLKLLSEASAMISSPVQNHISEKTSDFLQKLHPDVLQDQPLDLPINNPCLNSENNI